MTAKSVLMRPGARAPLAPSCYAPIETCTLWK